MRCSRCLRCCQIWEHTLKEFIERGAVVWLGDVAQYVCNDIVNGIDRCLDQATIEQQPPSRRHRPPALLDLAHNQASRPECLGVWKSPKVVLDSFGGRIKIVLDSGTRRGADMLRARGHGADFVMAGRALAYGVGAGGVAGANRAFDILELELARVLGQLGVSSYGDVGASELAVTSFRR